MAGHKTMAKYEISGVLLVQVCPMMIKHLPRNKQYKIEIEVQLNMYRTVFPDLGKYP